MQEIKGATPDKNLKIIPDCSICLIITTRYVIVQVAITRMPQIKCPFFITYFEIERERGRERCGERRGRESQAGSVLLAQSLMQGSNSQTIRLWPDLKSRIGCFTDWAIHVPLNTYFSHFWRLGSPREECQHGQVLVRALFLSHGKDREEASSLMPLLIRALILFMKTLLSWPNYLLKAPPPSMITMGIST